MLKSYSQYGEDLIVLDYFKNKKGNLLDLGANDGITFSNSKLLIDNGWDGVLIECSPHTFKTLQSNYQNHNNILCVNKCLSDTKKNTTFYHNTYHTNSDAPLNKDLLSTIDHDSYMRTLGWGTFETFSVECDTITSVLDDINIKKFNYLTIDIEGMDLVVLKQMDLKSMGVELIVAEHNNLIKEEIIEYCSKHNLTNIIFSNNVNIIITT